MIVQPKGFRKDTKPFFNQFVLSTPSDKKQTSPFIVCTKKLVYKLNTLDELLELDDNVEVLQAWPGKNRTDVFYYTVQQLRDHIRTSV